VKQKEQQMATLFRGIDGPLDLQELAAKLWPVTMLMTRYLAKIVLNYNVPGTVDEDRWIFYPPEQQDQRPMSPRNSV
jgi:hypothetical protein